MSKQLTGKDWIEHVKTLNTKQLIEYYKALNTLLTWTYFNDAYSWTGLNTVKAIISDELRSRNIQVE